MPLIIFPISFAILLLFFDFTESLTHAIGFTTLIALGDNEYNKRKTSIYTMYKNGVDIPIEVLEMYKLPTNR